MRETRETRERGGDKEDKGEGGDKGEIPPCPRQTHAAVLQRREPHARLLKSGNPPTQLAPQRTGSSREDASAQRWLPLSSLSSLSPCPLVPLSLV
ncbi:MAG: hypothetical protein KME31_32660 [Tolypothrix carrinoi HA7290-LM1]|jgi:hypothetical protein|nr:hypothetical protein [Tolypothrix carrinoi HA7290-LM1]